MKLKVKLKNLHFHTILMAMGFLVFSLLCWINLARGIVEYIKSHPLDEEKNEVSGASYEPALSEQNILQTIADRTDGNHIADYEGTNPYTDSEMENMLKASLSVQNKFADRGTHFVILVPPNKENIYSEFMPDTYKHADTSSTDSLIKYLYDRGVNIVSPKEELLTYHQDFQVYYSYDTH